MNNSTTTDLLKNKNEKERSDIAMKLFAANDSKSLDICIKTINDNPDILHLNYTPSVHCLIKIGAKALHPLINLMDSKNEMTRLRALTAIERITLDLWKKKYPDNEVLALENWKEWWDDIGFSEYDSDKNETSSIKKLKNWVDNNQN